MKLGLYHHRLIAGKLYQRLRLGAHELRECVMHSITASKVMSKDYATGDHARVEELHYRLRTLENIHIGMHEREAQITYRYSGAGEQSFIETHPMTIGKVLADALKGAGVLAFCEFALSVFGVALGSLRQACEGIKQVKPARRIGLADESSRCSAIYPDLRHFAAQLESAADERCNLPSLNRSKQHFPLALNANDVPHSCGSVGLLVRGDSDIERGSTAKDRGARGHEASIKEGVHWFAAGGVPSLIQHRNVKRILEKNCRTFFIPALYADNLA